MEEKPAEGVFIKNMNGLLKSITTHCMALLSAVF